MVIHVEDTTLADAAVVCSVWLPNVADLAEPPTFCLVTQVEAPVLWHMTRICRDTLIKGDKRIDEKQVVDKENGCGEDPP